MVEMSRAIITISGLFLVPVGASAAEILAASDLLALAEDARKIRKAIDAAPILYADRTRIE